MGARRCTVEGCDSISHKAEHKHVTFHTFPLNSAVRQIWISNCKLSEGKTITKSVLVCSKHFRKEDMSHKASKSMLKQGAIPSIFPWGTLPYVKPIGKPKDDSFVDNEELEAMDTTQNNTANESTLNDMNVSEDPKDQSKLDAPSTSRANVSTKSSSSKRSRQSGKSSSRSRKSLNSSKQENPVSFVPGTKVEAQDFDKTWHPAKVVEVDQDEGEVLIHFEKNKSKGGGTNDEWIPMDSNRLRAFQLNKKPPTQFQLGDKVMARWTGARKFPGTINSILENDFYEVLFDDGYIKRMRSIHIKMIESEVPVPEIVSPVKPLPESTKKQKAVRHMKAPFKKIDYSKLNLIEIPRDGEWCCHWVNDTPIGTESYLESADGQKRPTVLVEDWRLPPGWTKHMYNRSVISGKWDVVLVSPSNKRFRAKNDIKQYLEDNNEVYNPDVYDFSIHKRRAKDLGAYVFTDDYVPPPPSNLFNTLASTYYGEVSKEEENILSTALNTTGVSSIVETTVNTTVLDTTASVNASTLEEGFVYVGSLKVQVIDNLFRCPKENCNKNFRKENHLQIHVKHYHSELLDQLGVCPNMTDLAYLRTVGQPNEEMVPKLHMSNVQSIEKSVQSDSPKTSRKLSTNSSPKVKKDINEEEISSTDKKLDEPIKKFPLLEEALKGNDNVVNQSSSTLFSPKHEIGDSSTPLKLSESIGDFSGIDSSAKPPSTKKVSTKMKSSRHYRNSFLKKRHGRRRAFSKKRSITESMDFNEYGTPEVSRKRIKSQYSMDSARDTSGGSIFEHLGSNPRYVNEFGEMIKIVRMKQEEIINCHCRITEEDGLMIQCELCLCWQHGFCNGIERECDVPDKYICRICMNPFRGRESMKFKHDQDWLFEGKLPTPNYHVPNPRLKDRFDLLKQSHTMCGNLMEVKWMLHSLSAKMNIAENKDHPKLYLWSKKWEQSPVRQELTGIEPLPTNTGNLFSQNQNYKDIKNEVDSSAIKSNQELIDILEQETKDPIKTEITENILPNASDESDIKMETIEEVKTPEKTSDPNGSDKGAQSDGESSILAGILATPGGTNITLPPLSDRDLQQMCDGKTTPTSSRIEEPHYNQPHIPQPEAAIDSVECQHKLLEHIQKQQALVMNRLQTIEAQIITLEAMNENAEPLTEEDRFTKTKQTISMLIRDLSIMRRMGKVNCLEAAANASASVPVVNERE